jgi:hypothetical protein
MAASLPVSLRVEGSPPAMKSLKIVLAADRSIHEGQVVRL